MQPTVSILLYRAIWGWIDGFPQEYIQLCREQHRLEGRPDNLFRMCAELADTPAKKETFWPLQVALLLLCPDTLVVGARTHGNRTIDAVGLLQKLRTSCYDDSKLLDNSWNSLIPSEAA